MKILKKLSFVLMLFIAVIGIFNCDAKVSNPKTTNAVTNTFIDYMPITQRGQILSSKQLSFDPKDSKHAYVLANDSISISLYSLKHKYLFYTTETAGATDTYNYDNFEIHTTKIFLERHSEDYKNKTFIYNGTTYFYNLLEYSDPKNPNAEKEEYIAIYDKKPISAVEPSLVTSRNTEMISYEYSLDGLTISIIDAFVLKNTNSNEPVDFKLCLNSGTSATPYTITFMKTVVRFANAENPVASFKTYKDFNVEVNDYEYIEQDNWLQKEQTFTKLDFSFFNNKYKYLETNKLYFNINYNGFLYKLEMYASEGYLYVTYTDEVKLSQAKTEEQQKSAVTQLATIKNVYMDKDFETGEDIEVIEYDNIVNENSIFTLSFNKRGRYEIEIFDDTYNLGFENPNYYKTSFYIKNDALSLDAIFNNIYILAQTTDNKYNPIEYIVNGATLNNKVTSTIKNLSKFDLEEITLADIISKIDVTYTEFGNSDNLPTTTTYLPDDISENLLDENGDFKLSYEVDGYYQIVVYNKDLSRTIEYNFTIVMHAKTTYTIDGETYEAKTPYKTEIMQYSAIVSSSDPITFTVYYDETQGYLNKKLDISYLNKYQIIYGVQQVSIEFETDEDNLVLTITCKGVGELVVLVTSEKETMTYNLNSEKGNSTINISTYGKYSVSLSDSMGTATTGYYNFAKKMNMSTLILIGVSAFIVLAITLFIFSARGKLKTR